MGWSSFQPPPHGQNGIVRSVTSQNVAVLLHGDFGFVGPESVHINLSHRPRIPPAVRIHGAASELPGGHPEHFYAILSIDARVAGSQLSRHERRFCQFRLIRCPHQRLGPDHYRVDRRLRLHKRKCRLRAGCLRGRQGHVPETGAAIGVLRGVKIRLHKLSRFARHITLETVESYVCIARRQVGRLARQTFQEKIREYTRTSRPAFLVIFHADGTSATRRTVVLWRSRWRQTLRRPPPCLKCYGTHP